MKRNKTRLQDLTEDDRLNYFGISVHENEIRLLEMLKNGIAEGKKFIIFNANVDL